MNDRKLAKPNTPGAEEGRRGFGIFGRAVVYCVAWLPFLSLVVFFVPRFEDLFSVLRERGEVPAITEWLLSFSSLNKTLFFFPCLLVLVLLFVADAGVAGLLRYSRRKWLHWVWFVGVVAMGILAIAFVAMALLLPVLKMSASL
jgi:type II secretory pathway component PulF